MAQCVSVKSTTLRTSGICGSVAQVSGGSWGFQARPVRTRNCLPSHLDSLRSGQTGCFCTTVRNNGLALSCGGVRAGASGFGRRLSGRVRRQQASSFADRTGNKPPSWGPEASNLFARRRPNSADAKLGTPPAAASAHADISSRTRARWGRSIYPWVERNVLYSVGATLSADAMYQAYRGATRAAEVVGPREFADAVDSFFRARGTLVQRIGAGVFRGVAMGRGGEVRAEASRGFGEGVSDEARVLDEERVRSGRAASTSSPRGKGGRKQQQETPPETGASLAASDGDSGAGDVIRGASVGKTSELEDPSGKGLLSDSKRDPGREALSRLMGGQSAWLSAPLFAIATEKKNREAEERNAELRERIRVLKQAVDSNALTEGGDLSVKIPEAADEVVGGGQKVARDAGGGVAETPAAAKRVSRKKESMASVMEPSVSGGSGRVKKRRRRGGASSVNRFDGRLVDLNNGTLTDNGLTGDGSAEGARAREEFFHRLEEVRKGLGVAAQSLSRLCRDSQPRQTETDAAQTPDKLLGADDFIKLEGNGGTARRQLTAVGIGRGARGSSGTQGGLRGFSPRLVEDSVGIRGGNSAGSPQKRDANAAVAQMLASRKRFQGQRRVLARTASGEEGSSDSDGEDCEVGAAPIGELQVEEALAGSRRQSEVGGTSRGSEVVGVGEARGGRGALEEVLQRAVKEEGKTGLAGKVGSEVSRNGVLKGNGKGDLTGGGVSAGLQDGVLKVEEEGRGELKGLQIGGRKEGEFLVSAGSGDSEVLPDGVLQEEEKGSVAASRNLEAWKNGVPKVEERDCLTECGQSDTLQKGRLEECSEALQNGALREETGGLAEGGGPEAVQTDTLKEKDTDGVVESRGSKTLHNGVLNKEKRSRDSGDSERLQNGVLKVEKGGLAESGASDVLQDGVLREEKKIVLAGTGNGGVLQKGLKEGEEVELVGSRLLDVMQNGALKEQGREFAPGSGFSISNSLGRMDANWEGAPSNGREPRSRRPIAEAVRGKVKESPFDTGSVISGEHSVADAADLQCRNGALAGVDVGETGVRFSAGPGQRERDSEGQVVVISRVGDKGGGNDAVAFRGGEQGKARSSGKPQQEEVVTGLKAELRGGSERPDEGSGHAVANENGAVISAKGSIVEAGAGLEEGAGSESVWAGEAGSALGLAVAAEVGKEESGSTEGGHSVQMLEQKPVGLPSGGRKRNSSSKMIAQNSTPGDAKSVERAREVPNRKKQESEAPLDSQMVVSSSRRIGEEAQTVTATGPAIFTEGGGRPPKRRSGRRPAKNYTTAEDEQLFVKLGFRLTPSELSRIEEWIHSREVPELKLPRPRDKTGRYFVMPVVDAVEEHLRALGRLGVEPVELEEVFTPPPAAGAAGGENGDAFFQEMSKELSAEVVLQTRELVLNQDTGPERPAEGSRNGRSSDKKSRMSDFSDYFSDESDSDVETLFQKAGLTSNGGRRRVLGNLERAVIAQYLMGLNRQGNDPPRKEDWPCSPDGERYSKETLREVWRAADEMGGLPAYLKMCQEDEAVDRLLAETLCKKRIVKGEDWRVISEEEVRAVETMDPGERVRAVEFLVGILKRGEVLDWKKHRDIWPRKKRTAHLFKSKILLAIVKMAKQKGGMEPFLEICRKDLETHLGNFNGQEQRAGPFSNSPAVSIGSPGSLGQDSILFEEALLEGPEDLDELLELDLESDSDEAPDEPDKITKVKPLAFGGAVRREETEVQQQAALERGGGWRAGGFPRGRPRETVAPSAGDALGGGGRWVGQSGNLGRNLSEGVPGPSPLFSRDPKPANRPTSTDKNKIPRGFSIRRPKEPVSRDTSSSFATWRVGSNEPAPSSSPKPPPSPQPRKGGMIQSAADRAVALNRVATSRIEDAQSLSLGGPSPQQTDPPPAVKRWPGLYETKNAEAPPSALPIPGSPVEANDEELSASDEQLLSGRGGDRASGRELSPLERRRRRRLLGIKVQRHEDVNSLGENGFFEVAVGRPQRTMREILSGYAQETVLVRAEELAQPVLVEDNLRSVDEGLLERLVSRDKSEMDEFKDTSRQYMKAWQDFQTWSDFFQYKNKKLPTITDVEATCIPWLIEKAKAYVVLRKNMIKLAEGNEKLLSAMATIQAELNKRTTTSVATDKLPNYRVQAKPAPKKTVKRKPRSKKDVGDPVGKLIIETLENSEDELE